MRPDAPRGNVESEFCTERYFMMARTRSVATSILDFCFVAWTLLAMAMTRASGERAAAATSSGAHVIEIAEMRVGMIVTRWGLPRNCRYARVTGPPPTVRYRREVRSGSAAPVERQLAPPNLRAGP